MTERAPTRHSQLIAERQRLGPLWRTRGFRASATALLTRIDAARPRCDRMPDLVDMLSDLMRFIPDLYYVTDDPPMIAICEVECSNPVDSGKRQDIGALGDLLAGLGVDLYVLLVNSSGVSTEVDWQDWYMEMIESAASQPEAPPAPPKDGTRPSLVFKPAERGLRPEVARTLDEIIDASIKRRKLSRERMRAAAEIGRTK